MNKKVRNKRKLNTKKIALLLIIMAIIIGCIVFEMKKAKTDEKESWNIATDNYDISVDVPKLPTAEMQNEIETYLKDIKSGFLEEVKNYKAADNNNIKYELRSTNHEYEFDGVKEVRASTYIFNGGNHYEMKLKSMYYKESDNSRVTFNDLLEDKDKFALIIYHYTNKTLEELKTEKSITYSTDDLKQELSNYNFEHFRIENNFLIITYTRMELISWANGEIETKIPLSELKGILKPEFLKETATTANTTTETTIKPKTRNIEQFRGKKLIALTFDDGPSTENDKRIVNALKEYNGLATFFVLGSRVHSNREGLKYAYSEGNQIASHTYNHLNLPRLDKYQIAEEIYKTDDAVYKEIGIKPSTIRPPYGNKNKTVIDIANRDIILWSIDTLDWKTRNAESVKNEILKHAQDGAIVLMHDIYKTSADGAIAAMPELKSRGFEFVTIDEMMKLKGVSSTEPKIYYDFTGKNN